MPEIQKFEKKEEEVRTSSKKLSTLPESYLLYFYLSRERACLPVPAVHDSTSCTNIILGTHKDTDTDTIQNR